MATVKSDFARLSADYDEDVTSTASKYGYADTLRTASVDDKIKDVGEYLESRKQSREEALAQIAQNIKDQSDNLKASYDAVNQSFKAAVAGYDSGSSNCVLTAGTYCYFGAGDPPNAEGEMQYLGLFNARTVISAHMEVSKDYYTEPGTGFIMYSKKKGKYAGYSVTLPSSKVYKETASLAARCTQLEYWMGRLTFMDNTYGLKKDGTVMAAA